VGASQVVLHGVTLGQDGDLVISANALQLLGVVQGSGAANASLTTATQGGAISVGASNAAGALNLSPELLDKLQGFAQVMIGTVAADGHAAVNAGPVTLNSAALSHVVAGSLAVFGGNIELSGPVSTLHQSAFVGLDAAGSITMNAGSGLRAPGVDLTLQARGNVAVTALDLRASDRSGTATLSSQSGVISDADLDSSVNIYAGAVVMRGDGPLYQAGSQAAVIEVEAQRVNVDAGHGVVMRDGGTDGSSVFNMVDGSTVRQELVVKGPALRETSTPTAIHQMSSNASEFAAWLSALQRGAGLLGAAKFSQSVLSAAVPVHGNTADYLDHLGYDAAMTVSGISLSASDMLLPQSYGLAERLAKAYLLGAKALQPCSSGLQPVGADNFDYWEESLVI
jgi:hypothetical protein